MEKLPEKWQIFITPENENVLEKYRRTIPGIDLDFTFKGWLLSDLRYDRSGMVSRW